MNVATTILAQIDPKSASQVADSLAAKTDRALFIFALIVLLTFTGYVVRFLVKRNDVLTDKLEGITRESIQAHGRVAQCLDKVSERLDASGHALKQLIERGSK